MEQHMTVGARIRFLRRSRGLTQAQIAAAIGVSDKAVSKWERDAGLPDTALLPSLAHILGADLQTLLQGGGEEQGMPRGHLSRLSLYVCPLCGQLLTSEAGGRLHCCGRTLAPLKPRTPPPEEALSVAECDGELYVTGRHEMTKAHFITFAALLSTDTAVIRRCYPQWDLSLHLPRLPGAKLVWHCNRHGLFSQTI